MDEQDADAVLDGGRRFVDIAAQFAAAAGTEDYPFPCRHAVLDDSCHVRCPPRVVGEVYATGGSPGGTQEEAPHGDSGAAHSSHIRLAELLTVEARIHPVVRE